MSFDLENKKFVNWITDIIKKELDKRNLSQGNWQLGVVSSVISPKKLNVFVNGSTTPQEVSCNPDETFSQNDHVWVIFINGDSKNKFVLCRRAV